MSEASSKQTNPNSTFRLRLWLDRIRAGDAAAREELLRHFCDRLERLARKMLKGFPGVRRWADTHDVLHNSLLRLLRALEQVQPTSTREFFGLAAEQMRRELLDQARHFYGPHGLGANHASHADEEPVPKPADRQGAAVDLDRWCAFHEAVERLPAEEREVVGLVFYHEWTHTEIAELFGINKKTVQRRWRSACLKLQEELGGNLPGS